MCGIIGYVGAMDAVPILVDGLRRLEYRGYDSAGVGVILDAEGDSAGEMKHGPIALVDPKMPVVVVVPRDRLYEKVVANVEEVKARNGVVVALASDGDEELAARVDHVTHVPPTSELLTPILCTIPLQLLAYHIAVLRGCDVDQPRNLAKSVTVG